MWADDAVAFETLDSGVRVIPLPFRMRLRPDAAAFFEQNQMAASADASQNGAEDRAEVEPVPLAALLVLARTRRGGSDGAAVRVRRLSSAQAFTGVLTHAYYFSLQDAERKRSMMRHYIELVARVPVFEVGFRPGFEAFPAVLDGIDRLLDQTLGATPPATGT